MSMIGYFLLVPEEELKAILLNPESVNDLIAEAHEQREHYLVDVDKAWHCLHFLLTGTAWEGEPPLNFAVSGGTPVGDVDVGYGPARVFLPAEVRAIDNALKKVSGQDLVSRFDGRRMNELEIYPDSGAWVEIDPNSDEFGYYSGAFDNVKALIRRGSGDGLGLMVWLS
jgi:hypothetical protein